MAFADNMLSKNRRQLSKLLDLFATHLSWRIGKELPSPVPADVARDIALAWGLKSQGSELARRMFKERIAPRMQAPPRSPGASR